MGHYKEKDKNTMLLEYGPYTIIKHIGENVFKLDLAFYMGLHIVFNTNPSMLNINEDEYVMLIPKELIVEISNW